MYCTSCGMELNDSAKFCTNCGEKVVIKKPKQNDDRKEGVQEEEFKEKGKKKCPYCGELLDEKEIGCIRCGKVLSEGTSPEENASYKEYPLKLEEEIKSLGTGTIVISIILFILDFLLVYLEYEYNIIVLLFLSVLIYGPLLFLGIKLRNDNLQDLQKTHNKLKGLIVISIIIILLTIWGGNPPGYLIIIFLIFIFRAKRRVKEYL